MEHLSEFRRGVTATDHHHPFRQAVDPHHGVRRMDLWQVNARDVGKNGPRTGGNHHLAGSDVHAGAGLQRPGSGEPDVVLVEVHVVLFLCPVRRPDPEMAWIRPKILSRMPFQNGVISELPEPEPMMARS